MPSTNEPRVAGRKSAETGEGAAESSSISLPKMGLEKALLSIIPEVANRLSVITSDNVHEQREFIHETVAETEDRLLYIDDSRSVNLLRKLRSTALEAFVRSFEVAPPSPSELASFCREYLPDSGHKSNDTTIRVQGLAEAIGKLSRVAVAHVSKAISKIPDTRPTEKRAAEKILNYLTDSKR